MTGYKILTHDWRSPVQGGAPVFDGTVPHLLPEVYLDRGNADCGAGWNFCGSLVDAARIAGFWRNGRPSRCLVVEAEGDVVTRATKSRTSQLRLVRLCADAEIQDAMRALVTPWAAPEHVEGLVAEQWAWYVALGRPSHDPDRVDAEVGHLVVPRQWNDPASLDLQPRRWAMDNGAFSGFDPGAYMRMLEAYDAYRDCLFVTVPDVVGDAAATLKLFPFWSNVLMGLHRRPALVAQDGLQPHRVPWGEVCCLFIGGTTAFKESPEARSLCGIAKAKGIWVHWGRVNGKRRYELALKAGADSIDGTGFSMFPETNIRKAAEWKAEIHQQPELGL